MMFSKNWGLFLKSRAMMNMTSRLRSSTLFVVLFLFLFADAYDPADPQGNITIKWDFKVVTDSTQTVTVSIYNYQLYRHVASPGWKLSWTWPGKEVIWKMWGAEATSQGNCSRFKGVDIPHSCEKSPTIVDLPQGTPYNMQTQNCCREGVLTSLTQDPARYMASFDMVFGSENNATRLPSNFSIGIPGYSCSNASIVEPSKFHDGNRRIVQALATWEITCSYSQFRESARPRCCVSLSTFYNSSIVSCPHCSCGCQGSPGAPECVREGEQPNLLVMPKDDNSQTPTVVMCTQHMCPIHVHWHLKLSYKEYWRVKVTITNFNLYKNYSDWNLLIQHPNLRSLTQVFSFNYEPLIQYGDINDTGLFWGIQHYNDMLLQGGQNGNVQTEILLHKDPEDFTFRGGWAFPRRVLFDGHECVMPPPDMYPSLPNGSVKSLSLVHLLFLSLSSPLLLVFMLLS